MLTRVFCFLAVLLSLALVTSVVANADDSVVAEIDGEHEFIGDSESDDHAHEDHAHDDAETPFLLKVDPGAALWNLAIFAVVFIVLSKFAWPPILEGLKAREAKIHDDLVGAERSRTEASELLSTYQTQLDEAQAKVQSMLAEARRDAESSKQSILNEAKAEADRQRDRAVAEIESAKTTAVSELANQSSAIALQLARQVVGRELNESDHADLIRSSLDNLPSKN